MFDTYKAVCTRDGFGAVTPSEFSDMCAALEGHALITTTKAKGKGSQQGLLLQVPPPPASRPPPCIPYTPPPIPCVQLTVKAIAIDGRRCRQVSDSELRSAVQPTRSLARVLPDAA